MSLPFGFFADTGTPPPPPENLLINGDFSDGVTGWSYDATYGPGSISNPGSEGVVQCTGGAAGIGYQSFATVIGEIYTVTGNVIGIILGSSGLWGIRKADASDASVNVEDLSMNTSGAFSDTFEATATTSFILMQVNPSAFPASLSVNDLSVVG